MSAKRLIVNADDYGDSPGVSRGILEAHVNGIVTSTSVMIGSAGALAAVQDALRTAPNLGLGLHFTLSGIGRRPILPAESVPSLVQPDGTFYPLEAWLEYYEQFDSDEIARELTAQCECFTDIAGKPPDHLDGHHHAVYRHPAGLGTLFALAERYDIPIRNAGFGESELTGTLNNLLNEIPEPARSANKPALKAMLAGKTPPWPDRFEGDFYDTTATLGDLLLILTNLPDDSTTELMCHPGYADEMLQSDYTTKREDELKVLTHRSVREVIAAEGITLIKFSALDQTR
jgi:predicted glycoside hydrolase/deacetylase ChbG (UPF0249 family)